MKVETKLVKTSYNSHYIPIPLDIAEKALTQFGKRVFCTINGQKSIHCAIQRHRDIGYYLTIGKSTKAKINVESGAEIILHIQQDTSKYQAEMPEELLATIETDPESEAIFSQLTPGFQRSIIHYVDSAKRIDTRVDRALKILNRLKMGITDRKELFH